MRIGTEGDEPEVPGGALYIVEDRAEAVGGGVGVVARRTMTVRIEWRAAGNNLIAALDLVDPMTAWGTAALGGQRLGGLVHWIREVNAAFTDETRDYEFVLVEQDFEASYQHTVGNATAQA